MPRTLKEVKVDVAIMYYDVIVDKLKESIEPSLPYGCTLKVEF